MARTATIQTRIDAKVKNEAQKILDKLNISMSEAISMYLTQVTLHRGIPFDMRIPEIPNALTATTLRKSEEGKELNEVGSVDELFKELAK
ncbi:MAG: type II toxin-antitoxin system RelB/DinJ family antitoxin [candidate division KSB1 bacterium]|nr:type II toxin-antitoxin system RelB/DinJ family antitoxin [candidate division KSB1 bacterium]MDZ7364265.1 type II toxin-antitoxin system RelB/DinJ family antitoxin [candidate division KSB1 bacterium]MDZ7404988.1 type II toxin-antitoxin system RelB/DinJ family antitoxin [candidate division KSB1 bacterium]